MSPIKPYCEKLRRHFDAYNDDCLSPFLRGVVEKHLQSCAPCRREYTLLQLAIEAVRQKPAPDVPPKLLRKIIKDLSEPGEGGSAIPKELVDPNWLDGLQRT